MNNGTPIHRHLDPGDSLGEVLFGLIMALTVTLGARLAATSAPLNVHQLIATIIGCNLAWGVIDAVFFVLGGLFHRSRRARFYRILKSSGNDVEALAALEEEFGLEDEPLAVGIQDRATLYRAMLAVTTRAAPARARLQPRDFLSAFAVFLLVSAAALPAVMPFILVEVPDLALHLSNMLQILLLFLVGYWWGRYTDANPWLVGLTIMLLGVAMVSVAIGLGG
ncbi:VIT family protein [Rhizobium altiplani]|uniref:VIT family protein n=1 Tax=Rhizobium altiplani TaxID=1864509 RepID=A0A109J3Q9_9HYPH|nr:VIT1/CCC1 transporter family protein [Rhizobium altiplani]KWV41786.1 VIT family protein [Rhizobium altiplani]